MTAVPITPNPDSAALCYQILSASEICSGRIFGTYYNGQYEIQPTSSRLMGITTGRLLHRATPKHACLFAAGSWGVAWGTWDPVMGAKPHCRAKQLNNPSLGVWTWNSRARPVLKSPEPASRLMTQHT